MRTGYRHLMILLGICMSTSMVADTGTDYRNAQTYISSQHFEDTVQASVLKAKTTLPPTPSSAQQEKYYDHPETMNTDAINNVATPNTVGNVIKQNAFTRPKMTVNQQSLAVQFSKKVQDNATAISQGTYQDCHKKVITDITSTEKTCSTALPFQFDCVNTLHVRVEEQRVSQQRNISLSGNLRMTGSSHASITAPSENGFITGFSMHVRDGRNPWSCSQTYALTINDVNVGRYHGSCHRYLGDLQFGVRGVKIPYTHSSATLTLIGGRFSGVASGALSLSYQEKQKVPVKTWNSSCASIPASCHIDKTHCIEPGNTKTFDGIAVAAACWKETTHHQCGAALSQDCQALMQEGCTQIASHCAKKDEKNAGICSLYDETWSCPAHRTLGTGLQCGERFYCMDGSCQPTRQEKNKDVGRSVTELSAVASAGEDVKKQGSHPTRDPNSIRIFTGHAAHCREVVLGALNCCANRGWARGIFANCNDEEKALGHAKEQGGLVIAVGRYCSAHVLGICTEHKEGYCIFPSRIADDVQKDGRRAQLGRGFGESKAPDCSGLSPAEIGRINFDRVDFSNVVSSVTGKANLPSGGQSDNNIEKQIREAVARKAHD